MNISRYLCWAAALLVIAAFAWRNDSTKITPAESAVQVERPAEESAPPAPSYTRWHKSRPAAAPSSAVVSASRVEPVEDPPSEQLDEYGDLVRRVRFADPPAGLRALLESLPSRPDQAAVSRVLNRFHSWGRADGEQAVNYALVQLSGQLRLDSAVEAARGWAERDLPAAAEYVARLLTPQHDYLVYAMAQDFARHDGPAALTWALQRVPAEYRPTAAQHTIMEWLRQDTAAALHWTVAHAAERPWLNRAERKVVWESVFYLAGHDLAAAQKFLQQLPAGGAFETGADALLDRWIDRDLIAAGEWLANLSQTAPSLKLDGALATYAQRAAEVDPHTATKWAQLIGDDAVREATLRHIGMARQ